MDTAKETSKQRKIRSKIACRHCRRRKVRCDVYPRGSPCTNCRLDNLDCTICEKKRWHPKPNVHYGVCQKEETRGILPTAPKAGSRASPESCLKWNDSASGPPSLGYLVTPTSSPASLETGQSPTVSPSVLFVDDLPTYLYCDLRSTSPSDIDYLRTKGCFMFPEKKVQDDLLKCYFDYIHPQVPILDEGEVWEKYLNKPENSTDALNGDVQKISLLVFSAMLFAASTCTPMSVLRKAGYSSRREARHAFFSKARALYSLDVERDDVALLQSLLLMSYWTGASGDDKDSWHWSGLAFARASQLGLQREPNIKLRERQKALRKRCWWSCVVRDRLIALANRRSPRIRLDDCDVPLPTLADYNVGLRLEISDLSPGEELCKRTTTSMFSMQLIRLLLCIGTPDVSQTSDMEFGDRSVAEAETWARRLATGQHEGSLDTRSDLYCWRMNLPEVLRFPQDNSSGHQHCIHVHRNALQIYYHRIIISKSMSKPQEDVSSTNIEQDLGLFHQSMQSISGLFDELLDCDLAHYLPSDCIGGFTHRDHDATTETWTSDTQSTSMRIYASFLEGKRATDCPRGTSSALEWPVSGTLTEEYNGEDGGRQRIIHDKSNCERPKPKETGRFGSLGGQTEDVLWKAGDIPMMDDVQRSFRCLARDESSMGIAGVEVTTPSALFDLETFMSTDSLAMFGQ